MNEVCAIPPVADRLKALAAAVLLLGAAACASFGAVAPGVTTMSGIRMEFGKPTDTRFSPAGQEIWEYATGPVAVEAHAVSNKGAMHPSVRCVYS